MNSGRWWLFGGLGVLAIVALGVWSSQPPQPIPPQRKSDRESSTIPLPPISESPFLNTHPDVAYVGSEACRTCHAEHDATFRHTSMGQSMSEVDLAREPPDGVFDHPLSKRRYEVRRQNGQVWHRELLLVDEPEEVVLAEFPVKYVVGSGHHSLTYLVEVDGFLVESPVTWYTSRKAWGMSPGYDNAEQSGFERAAGEGCLTCHAGRVEAIDKSLHRMQVHETAIGCERCHGPGALHLEKHRDRTVAVDEPSAEIDHSIVNPAHLSRELSEAVCQQCHLRSAATIPTRGRQSADFRPALPLQDFRIDFRLDVADRPMTVVGHVEQLHLSRCYQKSSKLTCLTCHNPHDLGGTAKTQSAHAVCMTCHRPEQCDVDAARRERESPQNDCVHCHMPRSDTEIPHLAFTHHRIGIHDPASKPDVAKRTSPGRSGVLRPVLNVTWHSDLEQQRAFGLGYLEAANRESELANANEYRRRALELMTNVFGTGVPDSMLESWLARLQFDLQLDGSQSLATIALSRSDLAGQDRCNAMFVLADSHFQQGRWSDAVSMLEQLIAARRLHIDWLMLADCQRNLGQPDAETHALVTATRINTRLGNVHDHLAKRFAKAGNLEQAEWHKKRAVP